MTQKTFTPLRLAVLGLSAAAAIGIVAFSTGPKTANAEAKPALACVDAGSLFSRQVVSGNTLLIEDRFGRSALLTLAKPCSNIDELDQIGFEFNGSTQLCGPHDVRILHSRMGERPLTCLITNVKLMSREETKRARDAESEASKSAS